MKKYEYTDKNGKLHTATAPGPTGNFPKGKLNEDDEGELALAIAADPKQKKVVISFGTSVKWLALDPNEAREFAKVLMAKADLTEVKS